MPSQAKSSFLLKWLLNERKNADIPLKEKLPSIWYMDYYICLDMMINKKVMQKKCIKEKESCCRICAC